MGVRNLVLVSTLIMKKTCVLIKKNNSAQFHVTFVPYLGLCRSLYIPGTPICKFILNSQCKIKSNTKYVNETITYSNYLELSTLSFFSYL